MLLKFIEKYLTNVLFGAIILLAVVNTILIALLAYVDHDRDKYKLQVQVITAKADDLERKYNKRIKNYDYAIKEISKYYDKEIKDLKSFQRRVNETDCEAANRLLSNFRY